MECREALKRFVLPSLYRSARREKNVASSSFGLGLSAADKRQRTQEAQSSRYCLQFTSPSSSTEEGTPSSTSESQTTTSEIDALMFSSSAGSRQLLPNIVRVECAPSDISLPEGAASSTRRNSQEQQQANNIQRLNNISMEALAVDPSPLYEAMGFERPLSASRFTGGRTLLGASSSSSTIITKGCHHDDDHDGSNKKTQKEDEKNQLVPKRGPAGLLDVGQHFGVDALLGSDQSLRQKRRQLARMRKNKDDKNSSGSNKHLHSSQSSPTGMMTLVAKNKNNDDGSQLVGSPGALTFPPSGNYKHLNDLAPYEVQNVSLAEARSSGVYPLGTDSVFSLGGAERPVRFLSVDFVAPSSSFFLNNNSNSNNSNALGVEEAWHNAMKCSKHALEAASSLLHSEAIIVLSLLKRMRRPEISSSSSSFTDNNNNKVDFSKINWRPRDDDPQLTQMVKVMRSAFGNVEVVPIIKTDLDHHYNDYGDSELSSNSFQRVLLISSDTVAPMGSRRPTLTTLPMQQQHRVGGLVGGGNAEQLRRRKGGKERFHPAIYKGHGKMGGRRRFQQHISNNVNIDGSSGGGGGAVGGVRTHFSGQGGKKMSAKMSTFRQRWDLESQHRKENEKISEMMEMDAVPKSMRLPNN